MKTITISIVFFSTFAFGSEDLSFDKTLNKCLVNNDILTDLRLDKCESTGKAEKCTRRVWEIWAKSYDKCWYLAELKQAAEGKNQ